MTTKRTTIRLNSRHQRILDSLPGGTSTDRVRYLLDEHEKNGQIAQAVDELAGNLRTRLDEIDGRQTHLLSLIREKAAEQLFKLRRAS